MNKRIVSMTLALLLALSVMAAAFAGCSNQNSSSESTTVPTTTTQPETTTQAKNVSVEDLIEKIKTEAEMNQVSPMDNTIASEFYNNLDLKLLEEYSFNMPLMNVKCDELSIVKVKDAKDVEMVKKAMEYRYNNILKTWETYLPDQYEIAQKGKIIVSGNYIMLLVTEKVEDGVKTFNEALA